ncbi:MAG: sigma-70 family RNA polymerase sigma factor [Fuerstiella sp.]
MTATETRKRQPGRRSSDACEQQWEPVDRDQLIMDHLSYVNHILGKLLCQLPRGVDAQNLESAGILGLIEAASQFDPSRQVEFRTFSYQRIRGAILDELRRNCPLSQQMLQRIAHLRTVRQQFQGSYSLEQLAEAAGYSVEEVTKCIQAVKLTKPDGWNDSLRCRGHIGDNDHHTRLEREEMQQVLADGIETLPEQMRVAVALHYNEGLKLKEVGHVLNLSESRVSRILDAAREKLQDYVKTRGY